VGDIHGTSTSRQTSLLEFTILGNGCDNVSEGIDTKVQQRCASPFNELVKEQTNDLFNDRCVFHIKRPASAKVPEGTQGKQLNPHSFASFLSGLHPRKR